MTKSLDGVGVLVTRPAHQADKLCELIESLGGAAHRLPTLEILPVTDTSALDVAIEKMATFHIAIFVSANAVPPVVEAANGKFPNELWVAAVGGSTAGVLNAHGISVDLIPEQSINSEGLLAMDALHDVEDEKVVIFRGEVGRELLADTLRARGADVTQVPVYRRVCPNTNPNVLDGLESEVQVLTVTSNESLDNLLQIATASQRHWLVQRPLVVLSQRMADHATAQGFVDVRVTDEPGDAEIVKTLTAIAQPAA